MAASDLLLAIGTKTIDFSDQNFRGMNRDDFARFLPIVAKRVEKIKTNGSFPELIHFRHVLPRFISLREIDFGVQCINYRDLLEFLDKCPKLEKVTVPLTTRGFGTIMEYDYVSNLKQLFIVDYWNEDDFLSDIGLKAITKSFPNLFQLDLRQYNTGYGTPYGYAGAPLFQRRRSLTRGDFTSIAILSNLEYLSLMHVSFISDPVMKAISIGCVNLSTLILEGSIDVRCTGLAYLKDLPKLTRLNINETGTGFDDAIVQIAHKGMKFCSF